MNGFVDILIEELCATSLIYEIRVRHERQNEIRVEMYITSRITEQKRQCKITQRSSQC
jgi:hypothetical protein